MLFVSVLHSLPVFVFRVSFSVAVTDLTADDFTINAGNATAAVTSVVAVAPGRVLSQPQRRRLVTANVWDVTVTVTGNFASTPVILGLVDGGTEPKNQAVPAVGRVGDPHVSQYAPVEVVVSPGELLAQAGFTSTLGGTTSLTVLDVTLDFGDAGVTGVTVDHFVVDSPSAQVSVQVSPVGSDGSVATQLWSLVVTVAAGQAESRVRVYLDNSAGTIVPPPATRSQPVLDVTYQPPSDDAWLTLTLETGAMIAAGVVLCCVCVCGVLLYKSQHRGRSYAQGKSKVAPEPAPGGVAHAHIGAPMSPATVTPGGDFGQVATPAAPASVSDPHGSVAAGQGGAHAAWGDAEVGGAHAAASHAAPSPAQTTPLRTVSSLTLGNPAERAGARPMLEPLQSAASLRHLRDAGAARR